MIFLHGDGDHSEFLFEGETLDNKLEELDITAVFVCGGMTLLYRQALCQDILWLTYIQENKLSFGGTSAGSVIASQHDLLGGWLTQRDGKTRDAIFQGASEGIDAVTVKPGLGLVPFTVDVHASQMGTLTRLIHTVEQGLTAEGWEIDENTAVCVTNEGIKIVGRGHAYHIWRGKDQTVKLIIHTA